MVNGVYENKTFLIFLVILALGFISTLVSGLYGKNLSTIGVSKIGYGFPLSWHGHSWIVYPGMPYSLLVLIRVFCSGYCFLVFDIRFLDSNFF
jgi:hypothetical protein